MRRRFEQLLAGVLRLVGDGVADQAGVALADRLDGLLRIGEALRGRGSAKVPNFPIQPPRPPAPCRASRWYPASQSGTSRSLSFSSRPSARVP